MSSYTLIVHVTTEQQDGFRTILRLTSHRPCYRKLEELCEIVVSPSDLKEKKPNRLCRLSEEARGVATVSSSAVSPPLAADVHIDDKAVRALPMKVFLFGSQIYGSLCIVVLDLFPKHVLKERCNDCSSKYTCERLVNKTVAEEKKKQNISSESLPIHHKQKTLDKNSPISLGNAIKSDITVDGAILRKSLPFAEWSRVFRFSPLLAGNERRGTVSSSAASRPLAADVHIDDKAVRALPMKLFRFGSEL
ncbi:hypothetical protein CDAR_546371 [Caerostris darwini]|uniref:Uncharacterized protein n=1 Tax=Caerostris darwini TaxID=1538125 RepID=A0AAV4RJ87_9ARAC|nr:hypothetical protein CDAR_546371 [Caerostris darwini]